MPQLSLPILQSELVSLYKEMAELTLPKCKQCPLPLSCCSPEYCGMAIQIAKEDWGVELETTDHPTLPLMGPNGCTVAPHFRPLCTLHTCKINAWGFEPKDSRWTKAYFILREKLNVLESKKYHAGDI